MRREFSEAFLKPRLTLYTSIDHVIQLLYTILFKVITA